MSFIPRILFAALISKHPLALPISRFSVLPGGRLAGFVNTKSKRGQMLYENFSSKIF